MILRLLLLSSLSVLLFGSGTYRGAASVAVTKCNKLKIIDIYRLQTSIFVKRKVGIIA